MTESRTTTGLERFRARASAPVDIASLATFRVLFGLLLAITPARFLLNGWVDVQYGTPSFFFRYPGFAWVPVPSVEWIRWEFTALVPLGLAIALGLLYRPAVVAYALVFAHLKLIDVTNYLNHDYLVFLLLVVMSVLPLNAAWSVDARLRPSIARDTVPAWMTWLPRFQVALVYVFAAVAKMGEDWLVHAQPVGIWLRSRSELPFLGAAFEWPETAWAFAWGGFLYDLTIVGWLSWKRSRPFAYAAVLGFHAMTHALFDIGMFPFIMPVATTLFFAPDWSRRLLARFSRSASISPVPTTSTIATAPRWLPVAAVVWCVVHVLFPLRFALYPGNVLWAEEGMRWSWRVMVREKSGAVTFHVVSPAFSKPRQVDPLERLTARQAREMSTQPDLIQQFARHLAAEFEASGRGPVQVFADTHVSLNGRPATALVDPTVDLAHVKISLAPASWILPAPEGPPVRPGVRGRLATRDGSAP